MWHVFLLFSSFVFSLLAVSLLCASAEVDRGRALRRLDHERAQFDRAACTDLAEAQRLRGLWDESQRTLDGFEQGIVHRMRDVLLRAIAPRDHEVTATPARRLRVPPEPCAALHTTGSVTADAAAQFGDWARLWGRCLLTPACVHDETGWAALPPDATDAIVTEAVRLVLDHATAALDDAAFVRKSRPEQDKIWRRALQQLDGLFAAAPDAALAATAPAWRTSEHPRWAALLHASALRGLAQTRPLTDDECRAAHALSLDEAADFDRPVEILYGGIRGPRARTATGDIGTALDEACAAKGRVVTVETCADVLELERAAPEVSPLMALRMSLHCDVQDALDALRATHGVD